MRQTTNLDGLETRETRGLELSGKVAIVTGATRGLGRAIALGLAGAGCDIVVMGRTESPRRQLPGTIYSVAQEIEASGQQALPVACDVRDEASVQAMSQTALSKFGHVDVLVNNAGIGSYAPFLETSLDAWERVMAVNVRGTFLCCQAILPAMIEHSQGSVINISSLAADFVRTGGHGETEDARFIGQPYGASKAAVERLSRGLAGEMEQHNIAVNALKPAKPVLTEGFKLQRPNADWSRWVGTETMVQATLFLAGQDASGVTGAVVTDEELIEKYNLTC